MRQYKYFSLADSIIEAKQAGFADAISNQKTLEVLIGIFICIACCVGSAAFNIVTPSENYTNIVIKALQSLFTFTIVGIVIPKEPPIRNQLILGVGNNGICFRPLGYSKELVTLPWEHITNISSFCTDGDNLVVVKTRIDINECLLGGIFKGHIRYKNNLYEIDFFLGTNVLDFSHTTLCNKYQSIWISKNQNMNYDKLRPKPITQSFNK